MAHFLDIHIYIVSNLKTKINEGNNISCSYVPVIFYCLFRILRHLALISFLEGRRSSNEIEAQQKGRLQPKASALKNYALLICFDKKVKNFYSLLLLMTLWISIHVLLDVLTEKFSLLIPNFMDNVRGWSLYG